MKVLINNKIEAIMGKGSPLAECPKTYKQVSVVYHRIGDLFNPSQFVYNPRKMTIYMARDKSLRYEIYRDGSFFPFYGKLTLLHGVCLLIADSKSSFRFMGNSHYCSKGVPNERL